MSKVRDLPPISGSIIWARQIERQLKAYLRRVEDVLGKDWENHVEGQRLKADGDSFRQKLGTQELFDDWAQQVNSLLNFLFKSNSSKLADVPKWAFTSGTCLLVYLGVFP